MANRTELYSHPLIGPGYKYKSRRPYGPGEYTHLRNVDIAKEGYLINRRPLTYKPHQAAVTSGNHNPITGAGSSLFYNASTIVGHYKTGVVISGGGGAGTPGSHKWYAADNAAGAVNGKDLWAVSGMNVLNHTWADSLPANSNKINNIATDWRQIVGFFRYNKINYWIVQSFVTAAAAGPTVGSPTFFFHLLWAPDPTNGDITSITLASLGVSLISYENMVTTGVNPSTPGDKTVGFGVMPLFKKFFMHKDRLWIFTQKTAYFSKATDPSIWSTPDGGFYNFIEYEINDAVPLRDSIYFICDNSIWSLTYSGDPNNINQTVLRQLSDGQGGDSGCLYGDTVYFAKDDGLWSVSDQTLTRVFDLDITSAINPDGDTGSWKCVVADKYIILMKKFTVKNNSAVFPTSATNFDLADSTKWKDWPKYWLVTTSNSNNNTSTTRSSILINGSAYFINMESGGIHIFDSTAGYLLDAYFCPIEDMVGGVQRTWFLYGTHAADSGGGVIVTGNVMYNMAMTPIAADENYSKDSVLDVAGGFVVRSWGIAIDVGFDIYIDNTDEYWVKKFRTLLLDGQFGPHITLYVAYNNLEYFQTVDLNSNPFNSGDIPYGPLLVNSKPLRINLNQKARVMHIRLAKLYTDVVFVPPSSNQCESFFTLNDVSVTWTDTARQPTSRKVEFLGNH